MRRAVWALGVCLLVVFASESTALAASSVSLTLHASRVTQGGSVTVSGRCEPSTAGDVISRAFRHDTTHDFAGVGAVSFTTSTSGTFSVVARIPSSRALGTYQVTARCGGGNLGISRRLTVTARTLPRTGGGAAVPASILGLLLLAAGSTLLALERRVSP
jgi:hypothetical protein